MFGGTIFGTLMGPNALSAFIDAGTRCHTTECLEYFADFAADRRARRPPQPGIPLYGLTYDPFPGGHYIHPFHSGEWDHSSDKGKERPRTVGFPGATPRLCNLTGKFRSLK